MSRSDPRQSERDRRREEERRARRQGRFTLTWHKGQEMTLRHDQAPSSDERNAIYGPEQEWVELELEKRQEAERRGIGVERLPSVQGLDLDAEERKNEQRRRDPNQAALDDLRAEYASRVAAGFFRPPPAEPPAPTGRSARPRNPDGYGLIEAGFVDGEDGGGDYNLEELRGPRRGTGRKAIRRAERFTNEAGEEDYIRIGGEFEAIRKFLTRDGRTIEEYKSTIRPGRPGKASPLRDELATKVRELVFKRKATRKAIAKVLSSDGTVRPQAAGAHVLEDRTQPLVRRYARPSTSEATHCSHVVSVGAIT